MLQGWATPRGRTWTLIFLALCGAAAIAAVLLGVSDYPPGIFLALAAGVAFVLAFVHPWRTPGQFGRLLLASALGLFLFGILHNVFEALAGLAANIPVLHGLLEGIGIAAFLLATLICPAAILISLVALVVILVRSRGRVAQP
jgi:hypothetical protein